MSIVMLLLLPDCTAARYRKKADKETYKILEKKADQVPGMEEDFALEKEEAWTPLEGLPTVTEADETLGLEGAEEVGGTVISLERALEIAVKNSRTYQYEKEGLYLKALALTLDRHMLTPIFSGKLGGRYNRTITDVEKPSRFSERLDATNAIIDNVETITGTPADLLNAYTGLVETAGDLGGHTKTHTESRNERSVSSDADFRVDMLLKGGGKLALALTSSFLKYTVGKNDAASSTVLSAAFTQPLWRGAGAKVASEFLTQSERDVLYALRDFTRFRKVFAVRICSEYYGILQNHDIVRNNWRSYQNFKRNLERELAFAEEGRRTQAELGRLQQALLSTEDNWINSVRRYKESLDEFKIELGLSTDAPVVLRIAELDTLRSEGLIHPDISVEDAIEVASAARLDFYNERDRMEDAIRKIKVAKNALRPDVNLVVGGDVRSVGQNHFEQIDFNRTEWSAGLDLDLPLDRKKERNAYRAALIAKERALRDFSLAEDNVKLNVRAAWRNLDKALRNYEIALKSVELNERRVEEQDLLAELGRATVLNQVDAQNDLTEAQNNLTKALVEHTIARLAFWRDMGILYIKKDGQWEEVTDGYERKSGREAAPAQS